MPSPYFNQHVTVTLDKQRKMRYDMNSIAEIEGSLQCAVLGDGDNVFKKLREGKGNIVFKRALLWGGLLFDDPEITLQQVGDLMTFQNMAEVNDGIDKALRLFFQVQGIPIPEPNPSASGSEQQPNTGSGSGVSADTPTA